MWTGHTLAADPVLRHAAGQGIVEAVPVRAHVLGVAQRHAPEVVALTAQRADLGLVPEAGK